MTTIDELPTVQQFQDFAINATSLHQPEATSQLGALVWLLLMSGLAPSDCLKLRTGHLEHLLSGGEPLVVYDAGQVTDLAKELAQSTVAPRGQLDDKLRKRAVRLNSERLKKCAQVLLDGAKGCRSGYAVCAWDKNGQLLPKRPTASEINSLLTSEMQRLLSGEIAPRVTMNDVRTRKALQGYDNGDSLAKVRWYLGLRSDDDARAWIERRLFGEPDA